MKVEKSQFITEKKPALKELLAALLEKYEYASILATDSIGKSYSVSKTGTNIREDSVLCERGFVAKVYTDGEYAEYSFNEISKDNIGEIVENIAKKLVPMNGLLPECVRKSNLGTPDDSPICFEKATEYEIDPDDVGDEKIIEMLTDIHEKGKALDERVLDVYTNCNYQRYTKLFLSKNRDMTQSVMWVCGMINVMVSEGDAIEEGYKPVSMLGGMEITRSLLAKLPEAFESARIRLEAEEIVPGEYECICEPDVTGMIVHEAFGHGVEMDMFVKDRALAQQYVGKQVASELITMHDGACTIPQVATYFFDDDGVLAHDTIVIEKGILKQGICDAHSALSLNFEPTGNSRRQDLTRKAYTRMTNTIFEAGSSTVEEMISSVKNGLLLCDADSGMEDPKNWGIQLMVGLAKEIKDGKLTGKAYSHLVMTGYVPDLLKSISMISDKIEAGGSGYCGKGYKEWVKVSDGGPYIKAKIRLG